MACRLCGSSDHAEDGCSMRQSLEMEVAHSGAVRARTHPASKPFRDCRAQLRLALAQREEDPARVWLELVSVRESAGKLPELASDDRSLLEDIERFRAKLEAEIFALTQEVGDEVLAPLYVWVDLVRRRNLLDREILRARQRVKEARAARADSSRAPRSLDDAERQHDAAREKLEKMREATAAAPLAEARAVWDEAGKSAKERGLPEDLRVVKERAAAARARLGGLTYPIGRPPFVRTPLEAAAVVFACGGALVSSVLAVVTGATGVAILALILWLAGIGAVAAAVQLRARGASERAAAIDLVWEHLFTVDQAALLDVELGWLRALRDAFRARRAFDESKAEGKQIEDSQSLAPRSPRLRGGGGQPRGEPEGHRAALPEHATVGEPEAPSERARLADVHHPEALCLAARVEPLLRAERRLLQRLVGQPERAPVHRHERLGAQDPEGAPGVFGADVLRRT